MKRLTTYRHIVRLQETDAAGILFYGNIFSLVQCGVEEMMQEAGLPIETLIHDTSLSLPVVHTEANYFHPIRLGGRLTLSILLKQSSNRSFTLKTLVDGADHHGTQQRKAEVGSIHVSVDLESGESTSLPVQLQQLFEDAAPAIA